MAELTVELTYASALYDAAREIGSIGEIRGEAEGIKKLFDENSDLYAFFSAPSISKEERKQVIEEIFRGRVSSEMLHFLLVLLDNGRAQNYRGIVREFCRIADEEASYTEGQVYSVKPMSREQIDKLEDQISDLMKEHVVLENRIDKSLIGGFKVMADGKIFDASIKKKLDDMRKTLK